MATLLSAAEHTVLYVTGEESLTQLKMRAERLETPSPDMLVLSETNLDAIFKQCQLSRPKVLVIDSIQTIYKPDLPGSPGSMSQLRECTLALMVHAKSHRNGHLHRRPRDQGGRAGGPAHARAYGGHRGLFRGRAPQRLPHPARRQEPFRRHQRNRRFRNGGPGADAGGESVPGLRA